MRAMDVMTTDVITVDPETTVQAMATLLAERGISGAPVVDANGRRVALASAGVHGGSTISPPSSPAITSNRMAVP